MDLRSMKISLHKECVQLAKEKVQKAREILKEFQDAANEETKNTAGDKYETARAMLHLEQEKASHQMEEAIKLKDSLDLINPELFSNEIKFGSLIKTNLGYFYIAASIGKVKLDMLELFVISSVSPLGALFIGKKKGDYVELNGRKYLIEETV